MARYFPISARARSQPTARSWGGAAATAAPSRTSGTRAGRARDTRESTIDSARQLHPTGVAPCPGRSRGSWRRPPPRPSACGPSSLPASGFTTSTTAVVVDVVVRDAAGAPIVDLKPADFELLEDDVEQQVASVQLIAPGRTPGAPGGAPRRPRQRPPSPVTGHRSRCHPGQRRRPGADGDGARLPSPVAGRPRARLPAPPAASRRRLAATTTPACSSIDDRLQTAAALHQRSPEGGGRRRADCRVRRADHVHATDAVRVPSTATRAPTCRRRRAPSRSAGRPTTPASRPGRARTR